jgi:hypothetical protein
MIKTHVTWNKSLTQEEIFSINEYVRQMIQEEKTDGSPSWISETDDEKVVERNWTTL